MEITLTTNSPEKNPMFKGLNGTSQKCCDCSFYQVPPILKKIDVANRQTEKQTNEHR